MSWDLFVQVAWKSALVSALALALLALLRGRSAAERSWVAHAGLAATLLVPALVLLGPSWQVVAPAPLAAALGPSGAAAPELLGAFPDLLAEPAAAPAFDPGRAALWLYASLAGLLLLLTLAAVARLFVLRSRAQVLVEPDWLSALAHAQRRMGFKHGTALLVSEELSSPVSWGVLRPIILLNPEVVRSPAQAEAIIAHELAHVARLDWAKLLVARAATALFWFNPLVWLLARQCHQLREEAADDAVLASDVASADYAALLVGAARHESRGMLLAANGVAPGRGSLRRRVARVLDGGLARGPARLAWSSACAAGAVLVAAPLAALTPVGAQADAAPVAIAAAGGVAPAAPPMPHRATPPVAPAAGVRPTARIVPDPALAAPPEGPAIALAPAPPAAPLSSTPSVRPPAPPATPAPPLPPRPGRAVALPHFHSIELRGGGNVILRPAAAQSVRVLRGGEANMRVEGGRLQIDGCLEGCGRDGMVIEIATPDIAALAIAGGGTIEVASGFPPRRSLALAVRAGGLISAGALSADEVVAAIQAGGTIKTRPTARLLGAVNLGGSIYYWGDPEVKSSVASGGTIERVR